MWGSSTSQVQQKSCHSQAAGSVHCTLGMWQPVRTALRREELHNCWCGRQSVGARELHVFLPPCCPGLHICFLSISETQQELGSQVGTGGPNSSLLTTKPHEEHSYCATQSKLPFGKDHFRFSCFLNSYQPRIQPHSSLSAKPLLGKVGYSFTL